MKPNETKPAPVVLYYGFNGDRLSGPYLRRQSDARPIRYGLHGKPLPEGTLQ